MAEPLRILVLGYIVRGPLGGLAWHHLQYVLGLHRLGHEVYFLEDSEDYAACYDPTTDTVGTDPTYGLDFAARAFARLELSDRWAYRDAHRSGWLGPAAGRARELCRTADLLLNVSGVNPIRPWFEGVPARALVDTDPAFTQIRHLTDPDARRRGRKHNVFFTFGENLPGGASSIPDDGFEWRRTRQPVVVDAWEATPPPATGPFTTVMQWDSYEAREYEGRRYGMKSDSFGPYLDLPARTEESFELAVGSANAPRRRLREHGWMLRDPREPTVDPWRYQAYIRHSKAEFGVAKHGYAASWSGWFSERSASYMASGRPVVVQDTGFSEWLPTGAGVLPFRNSSEASAGVEAVARDPEAHGRTAREIVEAYFHSNVVLDELIHACAGVT